VKYREYAAVKLVASFFFLASLFAVAAEEPRFGPEFTFFHPTRTGVGDHFGNEPGQEGLAQAPALQKARQDMVDYISKTVCKARACEISEIPYRDNRTAVRVTYPDGFWFQIIPDPWVLEVMTKPSTLSEIKAREKLIQEHVFDAAKAVGLRPSPKFGGGHISISADVFDENPKLLRNFVVDWLNHAELSEGILENSPESARSATEFSERLKKNIQKVLREFDDGKIRSAKVLSQRIFDLIDSSIYLKEEYGGREVAVNLMNMFQPTDGNNPASRRVELRSIRAQKDSREYTLLTEMVSKRLEYLSALEESLEFAPPRSSGSYQERVARFYEYVTESGLDWKDYRKLLRSPYSSYGGSAKKLSCYLSAAESGIDPKK